MDTDGKLTIRELYNAQVAYINAAEAITWFRFNTFLIVNSVLLLTWSVIYGPAVASGKMLGAPASVVLTVVSMIGILGGIFWSELGRRGRETQKEFVRQAQCVEMKGDYWDREYDPRLKPIWETERIREKGPKWGTSTSILRRTPLAFSVVHTILASTVLIPWLNWVLGLGVIIGAVLGMLISWVIYLALQPLGAD
ncbi:MAG TPA: hypothetical protein VE008_12350 [Burkholderiales bacterium]|nr:hypothetical protein [Burkholderiales bacterium]